MNWSRFGTRSHVWLKWQHKASLIFLDHRQDNRHKWVLSTTCYHVTWYSWQTQHESRFTKNVFSIFTNVCFCSFLRKFKKRGLIFTKSNGVIEIKELEILPWNLCGPRRISHEKYALSTGSCSPICYFCFRMSYCRCRHTELTNNQNTVQRWINDNQNFSFQNQDVTLLVAISLKIFACGVMDGCIRWLGTLRMRRYIQMNDNTNINKSYVTLSCVECFNSKAIVILADTKQALWRNRSLYASEFILTLR